MINLQNKVDKYIHSGNIEFSENRNVISALVDYQRALDIYDYMDKFYKIQHHELLVRIAICYDILGNYQKTMDYLTIGMKIIPNICNLVLYKSVLYFANGDHLKGYRLLNKYKNLSSGNGVGKENLYDLFKLVFNYVEGSNKKKLLDELSTMLNDKNKRYALVYYLKAIVYLEIDKEKRESNINITNSVNSEINDYKNSDEYKHYEKNLKLAEDTDPADTEFLIKDGISSENLTKIFFMILPEMDDYQPKALANYHTFNLGISQIFTIYRFIKLLRLSKYRKIVKNKENLSYVNSTTHNSNTNINTLNQTKSYQSFSLVNDLKTQNTLVLNSKSISKNKNLNSKFLLSDSNEQMIRKILEKSIFTYYFSNIPNLSILFFNIMSNQVNKPNQNTKLNSSLASNKINYVNEDFLFQNYFIKCNYYSPFNIKNIYLKNINSVNEKKNSKDFRDFKENEENNISISRVSLDNHNLNNDESLILSFFKENKRIRLNKDNNTKEKPKEIQKKQKFSITNPEQLQIISQKNFFSLKILDKEREDKFMKSTSISKVGNFMSKNSIECLNNIGDDKKNPIINLKKKFAFRDANKNYTLTDSDNKALLSTNRPHYKPNDIQTIKFSAGNKKIKSNQINNKTDMNSIYIDGLLNKEHFLIIDKKSTLNNKKSIDNEKNNKKFINNSIGIDKLLTNSNFKSNTITNIKKLGAISKNKDR